MSPFGKKLLAVIVLAIIGISIAVFFAKRKTPLATVPEPVATSTHEVIGYSVENRAIEAYTFGTGTTTLLFVGGMHGGYEWNSVLLAYQFIDYLTQNFAVIPSNLRIEVIPSANPDGVYKVTNKEGRFTALDAATTTAISESGRFNAHDVDLNRNFDCKWQPESMWRGKTVSAGTSAFSEPETAALRDFIIKNKPVVVVFWHSQSNAVYASECRGGILPETRTIMSAYATAAGYPAVDTFDAYAITGDAEGWLASINIPAITVELSTHETIEWDRNLAGVKALFAHYSPST
jgi:hypothetical protein